ncbi:MAG: Slp family lipoprotein [Nitrospinaceae bacterium]
MAMPRWFYLLLGAVFLFSGCAPVLSQRVLDESTENVPFWDLQRHTENYIGKSVLLGGTVIQVGQDASGSWVEVLQRPLGYRLEPQIDDRPGGRFLLLSDGVLEEEIFSKGRKITVAGIVQGKETRPLDQTTYDYPLLKIREYHLWPKGNYPSRPRVFFSLGLFHSF